MLIGFYPLWNGFIQSLHTLKYFLLCDQFTELPINFSKSVDNTKWCFLVTFSPFKLNSTDFLNTLQNLTLECNQLKTLHIHKLLNLQKHLLMMKLTLQTWEFHPVLLGNEFFFIFSTIGNTYCMFTYSTFTVFCSQTAGLTVTLNFNVILIAHIKIQ